MRLACSKLYSTYCGLIWAKIRKISTLILFADRPMKNIQNPPLKKYLKIPVSLPSKVPMSRRSKPSGNKITAKIKAFASHSVLQNTKNSAIREVFARCRRNIFRNYFSSNNPASSKGPYRTNEKFQKMLLAHYLLYYFYIFSPLLSNGHTFFSTTCHESVNQSKSIRYFL